MVNIYRRARMEAKVRLGNLDRIYGLEAECAQKEVERYRKVIAFVGRRLGSRP